MLKVFNYWSLETSLAYFWDTVLLLNLDAHKIEKSYLNCLLQRILLFPCIPVWQRKCRKSQGLDNLWNIALGFWYVSPLPVLYQWLFMTRAILILFLKTVFKSHQQWTKSYWLLVVVLSYASHRLLEGLLHLYWFCPSCIIFEDRIAILRMK